MISMMFAYETICNDFWKSLVNFTQIFETQRGWGSTFNKKTFDPKCIGFCKNAFWESNTNWDMFNLNL
jgi:hypothetical protein